MPADLRPTISAALNAFEDRPVADAARRLFSVLGYESDRTLNLGSSEPQAFLDFVRTNLGETVFNEDKAVFPEWRSADLLFQFTGQELSAQLSLFDETDVNVGLMQSYVFFAIELAGGDYARGKLTNIARQINRVFPMPVMVLLKHLTGGQPAISIAVINRRRNKRDEAKDVLGKVTIIRDIMLS